MDGSLVVALATLVVLVGLAAVVATGRRRRRLTRRPRQVSVSGTVADPQHWLPEALGAAGGALPQVTWTHTVVVRPSPTGYVVHGELVGDGGRYLLTVRLPYQSGSAGFPASDPLRVVVAWVRFPTSQGHGDRIWGRQPTREAQLVRDRLAAEIGSRANRPAPQTRTQRTMGPWST